MQPPWMRIWILSYYEVFTVSIDGGFKSPAECPLVLNVLLLTCIEHIYIPTRVSITTPDHPMRYMPETKECSENLDHSFGTMECQSIFWSVR